MCVHVAHVYVCIYVCAHEHERVFLSVVCILVLMCVSLFVCLCVCLFVCVCVCLSVCMSVYALMCIYACIYVFFDCFINFLSLLLTYINHLSLRVHCDS